MTLNYRLQYMLAIFMQSNYFNPCETVENLLGAPHGEIKEHVFSKEFTSLRKGGCK